jgi:micrococcal nuclease
MKNLYFIKRLLLLILLSFVSFSQIYSQDFYKVKRVIDGDTFELTNGDKVRLIGIDTPETVHPQKPVQYFGKEASAFTKKQIEGKKVRLEYDVQKSDKYGRLLAYVYLENGTFLNAELVKQGYANVSTYPPNVKFAEHFTNLQKEARENNRGLWGETSSENIQTSNLPQLTSDDNAVYITKTGKKYHRDGCRYLSKSKIPISLEDAVSRYSPCSVCNPPSTNKTTVKTKPKVETTVYVTRTGAKYHRAGCRYLRRSSIPMSLSEAKLYYSPCSVCRPPY